MHMRTYLRFKADYPIPAAGESGAGQIAASLVAGLRTRGFAPSEPADRQFAHFFRCASGPREYEVMAAFDFVDAHTWEVSCPRLLGSLSRLFGKTEDKELSSLLRAIHETIRSDSHVKEIQWYPRYGDKSHGSPTPAESV